jgi:hypothetical protein
MLEIITEKLIYIALFIFIIHSIETLAYAVRLSGARVKMIATALSLFNIMVMVSSIKRGITHFNLPKFSYLKDTKIKDIPIRLFL